MSCVTTKCGSLIMSPTITFTNQCAASPEIIEDETPLRPLLTTMLNMFRTSSGEDRPANPPIMCFSHQMAGPQSAYFSPPPSILNSFQAALFIVPQFVAFSLSDKRLAGGLVRCLQLTIFQQVIRWMFGSIRRFHFAKLVIQDT